MAAVLYGATGSGSAAVEAGLALTGHPFRMVEAAPWLPKSAMDELRTVNPLGQIPTLVWEDGTVMTESAAILAELGLRFPASGLLPADPAARAQVLRGLVFIAANCYAVISVIDYPDRVLGEAPSKADAQRVVKTSRARLHALWTQFADQFGPPEGQPFLGGDAPNALDVLATVVSQWAGTRAHLAATRPALSAVFARLRQHAVVGPVLRRHWPSAPA